MRLTPAFALRVALALSLVAPGALCLPAPAADYASGVRSKIVLRTTVTSNGEPIRYPSGGRPEVTAAEVEIAPGAETGFHSHPGPVYAWVVAGTLTIEAAGGGSKTYVTGDPIVEMTGASHSGRNAGTVPAKLLVFYLGTEGSPVTVPVKGEGEGEPKGR